MLKNYVRIALRTLKKNKISSLINLFGLSIAIGCSIVVYLFLQVAFTLNDFHEHGQEIFLVEHLIDREGDRQAWGTSPIPLGPAMEAEIPQVVRAVRIARHWGTATLNDHVFSDRIHFADEGFFEMFTFPLQRGSTEALADHNAVILSEPVALKYFGEQDPLGRQITITFADDHQASFTVGGVAKAFPRTAEFAFSMLINYETQRDLGIKNLDDWEGFTRATFIQLRQKEDLAEVAAQMDRYRALQNAATEDRAITSFAFNNLRDPAPDSHEVNMTIISGFHPAEMAMMALIAIFLLALSCFNYMNISLASAAKRLKEIGIRKVVGGTRRQLIGQFLTENILLCLFALLLGVVLAQGVMAPALNAMNGDIIALSFTENGGLWLFLVGLLLGVGLVSGAYPAFYVSSFQPVTILRGQQKLSNKKWFTRSFLTFQFVLTFITMVTAVTFSLNIRSMAQRDWGYQREHTLVVELEESSQFALLRDEALKHPNVLRLAGSDHHIGVSEDEIVVTVEGKKMDAVRFDVGPNYFETLGLRLTAGRFFEEALGGDASGSIVINERFVEAQGWTEPVGQSVRFDSTVYAVVGVVKDFHYDHFSNPIDPAVFHLTSEFRYLSMHLEAGTGVQTDAFMERTWTRLFPDRPYEAFFQDTVFDGYFRDGRSLETTFTFTAVLALLISCLGLFGLASQNLAGRMKEISIRKVLGASVPRMTRLVNQGFLLMLVLAALLATPVSYLLVSALLDAAADYHIVVGPLPFMVSFALVLVTATLTISTQVYKLVMVNPADVLRTE